MVPFSFIYFWVRDVLLKMYLAFVNMFLDEYEIFSPGSTPRILVNSDPAGVWEISVFNELQK